MHFRSRGSAALPCYLALACFACGSSDDDGSTDGLGTDDPTMMGTGGDGSVDPNVGDDVDPVSGLPFCGDSLVPGQPCADETHASICAVETGYPGDDAALCQRDESLMMHYGPDDYDDPDAVAPFVLEPGLEDETCQVIHSPNDSEYFFRTYHGRLRPQSHHVIVYSHEGEAIEDTAVPVACNQAGSLGRRWLVGSQDPQMDVTMSGATPDTVVKPEDPDYNVVGSIPPNVPITFNVHYINATSEPILKEAWVSFDAVEPSDDLVPSDMLTLIDTNISVPPNSKASTEPRVCVAETDRYVGLLTGHFHENGLRFSVWKQDVAGDRTLVYETYDWADPGNLFYRDGVANNEPNAATGSHGGHDGYLHLDAGEALVYQCEFENPTDVEVGFGLAGKDQMCNLFGFYYPSTGSVWGC